MEVISILTTCSEYATDKYVRTQCSSVVASKERCFDKHQRYSTSHIATPWRTRKIQENNVDSKVRNWELSFWSLELQSGPAHTFSSPTRLPPSQVRWPRGSSHPCSRGFVYFGGLDNMVFFIIAICLEHQLLQFVLDVVRFPSKSSPLENVVFDGKWRGLAFWAAGQMEESRALLWFNFFPAWAPYGAPPCLPLFHRILYILGSILSCSIMVVLFRLLPLDKLVEPASEHRVLWWITCLFPCLSRTGLSKASAKDTDSSEKMGTDFSSEDVDNAEEVGEIIAAVQENIDSLKVWQLPFFV